MGLITRRNTGLPTELDEIFSSFFRPAGAMGTPALIDEGALALDVSENDQEVIVRASLPGFSKEDVEVEVHDGVLSIKATREEEHEEKNERFYRKERRSGSVSRRIALPGAVDDSKASATLRDGVLEVRVSRSSEALPKRLNIG